MNRVKGEGVPDFVLLEQINEDAIIENIRIRYKTDNIYTYIGDVVISINPYKSLDKLYNKQKIEEYRGRYFYEVPPHIYALSNDVYRSLLQNQENQCVIISGESGAGKTEASKILMQYIAAVSKSSKDVDRVKNQLLESNPILEAFGNSKTIRNDNSSRFGKYMEIQFEKDGAPVGGKISNYLLEKTRVVNRSDGERSFHLLTSSEANSFKLKSNFDEYFYLSHSKCNKVDTINDNLGFQQVNKSLDTLGFSLNLKQSMWKILAGILYLGNIKYEEIPLGPVGQKRVRVVNEEIVTLAASLFQCDSESLKRALTFRTISTGAGKRQSIINVPLDIQQGIYTRDALAKAIYERLFNWLVQTINSKITCNTSGEKLIIGILDIYGFEIFDHNSFEQFCINLCNEKLQQLFIELTLKSEQEEYIREGIKWEQITYFNNKIICELIEGKPIGIISMLDECCLLADSTDLTFLNKCNQNFGKHKHYQSYSTTQDRTIPENSFRLKHYAGDVTYNVMGFLDKNKDTLFVDLINTMKTSKDPLLHSLFPPIDINSKKRPLTAATQFKMALQHLMETLLACHPHYIRCIKPNDDKRPGDLNEQRVRHQVRYLGLLENIRVRRAGFAYRQTYERFMWRYKMICPNTWPQWTGDIKEGVKQIINYFNINLEEYRMGKTKIFIRNPTTLFFLEEKREECLPRLVTFLQAAFKGFNERSKWAERKAAIKIQSYYKKYKFRKYFQALNEAFQNVKNDPNWGKNISWPPHPKILSNGIELLHKIHANWRARMMITALSPQEQAFMRQKVLAYNIFKGNKPWAISRRFDADYLELNTNPYKEKYIQAMQVLFQTYGDTQIMFSDYSNKINRVGKSQKRGIVVTEKNIYKHDPKSYKVKKMATPLVCVTGVSCSNKKDNFIVIHAKPPYRDLVLDMGISGIEKFSEIVTVLVQEIKKLTGNQINVTFSNKISYNNSRTQEKPGKQETLAFENTNDPKIKCCFFKPGKLSNIIVYPEL